MMCLKVRVLMSRRLIIFALLCAALVLTVPKLAAGSLADFVSRNANDATKTPNDRIKKFNDATRNPNDATRNSNDATRNPNDATKNPNDARRKPNGQ